MRKLIHSSFELDLSLLKISDTEENNWYSDVFFTKYTFPFDIDLTDDLDIAFEFIRLYNSSPQTYYELKYVHNDKIEDAIFEVESIQDKLSCTLRFGLEQLPSFEKKLSELSLEKVFLPIETNIFQHAQSVITQTWPAVNYNFPQVHVDKYDPTDSLWNGFEKIINKRVAGVFLENTVDIVEEITYNRNVMQPMPYWLHILQRGMIDGGYTLSGKILTDQRLQKACLFGDVDYFSKPTVQEPIYIYQMSEDAIEVNYNNNNSRKASKYYSNSVLTSPGKYAISGTFLINPIPQLNSYFVIKYRNQVIYSLYVNSFGNDFEYIYKNVNVSIEFETIIDANMNDITIESYQEFTSEKTIIDLEIKLIRLHDATGAVIPSVINENHVNLTKAVPNITFGDFIKVVKNWFNYDLTIVGKMAIMNPIEYQINYSDAIDLQFTEIKKPLRNFSQGKSFLLKFQDVDNKEFSYLPVFHNRDSVLNSNYITDDKTTPIEIPALPLPILTRNNIQTAYALETNDAKVYLINYDGMYNGNNLAKPITDYLLPSVHLEYWKKWFNFRINAHAFTWSFKVFEEQILELKAKAKVFAYNRFHIIKSINRTEINPKEFEIELETDGLE